MQDRAAGLHSSTLPMWHCATVARRQCSSFRGGFKPCCFNCWWQLAHCSGGIEATIGPGVHPAALAFRSTLVKLLPEGLLRGLSGSGVFDDRVDSQFQHLWISCSGLAFPAGMIRRASRQLEAVPVISAVAHWAQGGHFPATQRAELSSRRCAFPARHFYSLPVAVLVPPGCPYGILIPLTILLATFWASALVQWPVNMAEPPTASRTTGAIITWPSSRTARGFPMWAPVARRILSAPLELNLMLMPYCDGPPA